MPEKKDKQQNTQRRTPDAQRSGEKRQEEHHHAREFALILAAVVLLALIGGGWWYLSGNRGATVEIAPGVERRTAQEGDIIPGFPEELIQEDGVVVNGSYVIDYADNNKSQPVVRYTSELSMAENVERYGAYLDENNWLFTQTAFPDATSETYYYADRGESEEVMVSFIPNDDGTIEVNVAYLVRR